jgi:apolipoprotein D and lipocalin family protein
MKRIPIIWLTATLALAGCATQQPPLSLAPNVDLSRYYGTWFIIAEIPYIGERGNVGATAVYKPLPDGRIRDEYHAHEHRFDGKAVDMAFTDSVVPGTNNAKWRVHLFWPISVSYPILYVSPDYQVSLVGYPDRSLGWIFSRTPDMTDADYHALLARFAAEGYDTSKFARVAQRPGQIGQPGFN